MTKSKLYKITAWRDNAVKIVLTQGEGSNADNPSYNKTIQFRLTESADELLTVPNSAEIVLAIERPDNTTDLLSGFKIDGSDSDIEFDVKNTLTACAGIVKGEIRIITADSVVKFYGVNFNVYAGINDDGAIQAEQFDALVQALQKVVNVTGDGEVATMDSVIAHGGTNPVASGIIYDYLATNYYTKTEADNKYQTLANKTQTIDSDRQTTTADSTQYPSVAAVKEFLYANFMTEQEIEDYLNSFYTQAEADNKFALKSNSYTKAEINAIQSENDKRFALHMSVGFDDNGVPVKFVSKNNLSAGDFASDNIIVAFIGSNVQLVQSGAFISCNNLTDIYVDKKQTAITIQDGAIPAGVTVHYMDGFNYGELIIAAVKYLNTIKANAADVYTKSQTDNIIEGVTQQIEGVTQHVMYYTLTANGWNNGEQEITINAGDYDVSAYTKVDIEPGANALESLVNDGVFALYIENDNGNLTAKVIGDNMPRRDIIVQLVLSEVTAIESESE